MLLIAGCGGRSSKKPSGGLSCTAPPTQFEEVLRAEDRGFFSLHDAANGEIFAGTYGNPHVWASRSGDRGSWHRVDGRIDRAGESVFDFVNSQGRTYAAVESNARVYVYVGGGFWEHIFRAHQQGQGDRWNNSYSLAEGNGWIYTGINEFPRNERTMFFRATNAKGEHDAGTQRWKILNGIHHVHVGWLDGHGLYFNGRWTAHGGSGVWRMTEDFSSHREIANIGGRHPSRMRRIGDALWFANEGTGKVYRVRGDEVKEMAQVGETGLMGRVTEHNGSIYVIAGKGWNASGGRASLWCLGAGGAQLVAEFNEPEGWDALSRGGRLYIATRHKDGGGKVYRSR